MIEYDFKEMFKDIILKSNEDNEKFYHQLIQINPELLETGMILIAHEESVAHGRIDLHLKDINNNDVIVEVKMKATKTDIFQLLKYQTDYPNARLIIAAKTFTKDFRLSCNLYNKNSNMKNKIEVIDLSDIFALWVSHITTDFFVDFVGYCILNHQDVIFPILNEYMKDVSNNKYKIKIEKVK